MQEKKAIAAVEEWYNICSENVILAYTEFLDEKKKILLKHNITNKKYIIFFIV